MTHREPPDDATDLEAQAASWLARRDRGLRPADQDAYLQWLREDPSHGLAVARLEKTWGALDALASCRPAANKDARPNPDLLAPPRRAPRLRFVFTSATLAAACVAGFFLVRPESSQAPVTESLPNAVRVIPGPERLTLIDGSAVDLNHGSRVETAFTPGERRVRLADGEAHFTIAKNPARPFVVDTGGVAVRAVGTAFDVRRSGEGVEILVTEGKVQVERRATVAGVSYEPTPLEAGQRAVVDPVGNAPPAVTTVTPADIERALAWRSVQLEFSELPLAEVVAAFNRRNPQQVIVSDAETARLRVAGRFRADNVEGFVRLLEASFGVTAERREDGTIVLRLGR